MTGPEGRADVAYNQEAEVALVSGQLRKKSLAESVDEPSLAKAVAFQLYSCTPADVEADGQSIGDRERPEPEPPSQPSESQPAVAPRQGCPQLQGRQWTQTDEGATVVRAACHRPA